MSGALPTSPAFADIKITSIQPTLTSRTISGKRQTRQVGGQYWRIYATYPPMTRAQFDPIFGFLMKQRGSFETFTFIPPVVSSTTATGYGTPVINGGSQTGRTVNTDGWTANQSAGNLLQAGNYLKFANHSKVYVLTDANTSGSSGESTLSIEPALLTSPADGSAITIASVPFTVYLMNSGLVEYNVDNSGLFYYDLDLCEAL